MHWLQRLLGTQGAANEVMAASASERYGGSEPVSTSDGWFVRLIGGGKTKSGVSVNEHTARGLPAVYACINRIGNPIASFPVGMFRRRKSDGTAEPVTAEMHPFANKLSLRPNEAMSSRTLRKTGMGHALLWGNGYAEIERNGRGQAVGLYPLLPDRTRPVREGNDHFFRTNINGRTFEIPADDVIHVMDQSQDGYVGISQIAMARQAVGLGLATEEFGAKFFANDAKSGGFLMHPGRLGTNGRRNLTGADGGQKAAPENPASQLERQGGLDNAHRVKVLEEGMKFIQTTIPPEDAQFLATREFQIAEIARIYDVPLILLQSTEGTTAWGSGIEQLMIGFVRQTIAPWVDAWEQECNWKLFTEEEIDQGYYIKFNMNGILRGDMAARAAFYREMFGIGGFSTNMILGLEEMDGIGTIGDHHFVPSNYQTIENAVKAPAAPKPTPPAPAEPEEEKEDAA